MEQRNIKLFDDWSAMRQCPRWDTCNANICPLDPKWEFRKHAQGESVCLWLTERVKRNAVENFMLYGMGNILPILDHLSDRICAAHPIINRAVLRAKTTGSLLKRWNDQKGKIRFEAKVTCPDA